jgi:serine-type D-Ala-D-Ala carboxypeptidase/endopeptidase (penicillin-binding protein 4)
MSFFTCVIPIKLQASVAFSIERILETYRLQTSDPKPVPLPKEDILVGSAGFKTNEVSAYVVDLAQNKEVYNLNEDKFFIPASVSKLFTAIASIKNYGLDHQFETKIFTNVPLLSSNLSGDLILQGGGDPSLDYADIERLAQKLKLLGVQDFKGKLYFDNSIIPTANNISTFFGLLDVYNPAISSFNFNRSRIPVKLKKSGGQYLVSSQEVLNPNFQILVSSNAKATDPLYSYNGNSQKSVWTLNLNHALANYTFDANQVMELEEIPMLSPAPYFTQMFFKSLKSLMPTLSWDQLDSIQMEVSSSDLMIASIKGKNLRAILEKVLLNSDNAYTEMLSARLAYDLGVEISSLEENATHMLDWWAINYPQIDLSSIIFKRTSGLTPKNYLTSRQLVDVLEVFHKSPVDTAKNEFLENLLPISGVRGELENELEMPAIKGKIYAKSGYLSYVRALSGYLITQKGRKLAFSIMINDFDQREILNNPSHPDYANAVAAADAWATKSKNLRDALLLKWATEN